MKLLEDIVLTESIEIRTTPERIFGFFLHIVDDASYRAWHPQDHVAFRLIRGQPCRPGSVVYAEERIHGRRHKLKFLVKEVVPNRKIEFVPLSRLLRIYFPRNTFLIEARDRSCVFTASSVVRVGHLVKLLARNRLEQGLASARRHMREEGENMKRILEKSESHDQAAEVTSWRKEMEPQMHAEKNRDTMRWEMWRMNPGRGTMLWVKGTVSDLSASICVHQRFQP